jgi:hypothetical protein
MRHMRHNNFFYAHITFQLPAPCLRTTIVQFFPEALHRANKPVSRGTDRELEHSVPNRKRRRGQCLQVVIPAHDGIHCLRGRDGPLAAEEPGPRLPLELRIAYSSFQRLRLGELYSFYARPPAKPSAITAKGDPSLPPNKGDEGPI